MGRPKDSPHHVTGDKRVSDQGHEYAITARPLPRADLDGAKGFVSRRISGQNPNEAQIDAKRPPRSRTRTPST